MVRRIRRRAVLVAFLGLASSVANAVSPDPALVERADAGDPHFQRAVGVRLLIGADNDEQRVRGTAYLERSRAQGVAAAAAALAYAYAVGDYLPRNPARATRNYEIAVAQEDTAALREYGLLLWHGHGVPRDQERGRHLLVRAAQLGDDVARLFVARLLDDSDEPQDARRARDWRAGIEADRMPMLASYFALQYQRGTLVPADPARADEWWAMVDEKALHTQLSELASYYYGMAAVQRDARSALAIYERLMTDPEPETVNGLAWLLATARDDRVRDGPRAVALMQTLLASTPPQAAWVDTLAAAYAETGDFERAVEAQREAMSLATVDDANAFGAELDAHMQYYAAGKPWRE